MRIATYIRPTKFAYPRPILPFGSLRILDVGCGNNSPSTAKHWFPDCHYAGADIQQYNNNENDLAAIDAFYPLGLDGTGYDGIPDASFDFIILNHVVEHMRKPYQAIDTLCAKLKPNGVIWIAFPSLRTLSLPSADGTLHFSDDPTHVHVMSIPEICNVLLSKDVKIVHAGRSHSFWRECIGAAVVPFAFLRKMVTGRLSCKGLWYILGFEDHVLGQRKV